jgi:hypothetical protein
MSPLELALSYIARGWNPVPVSRKTKKPFEQEWQLRKVTAKTAAKYFNGSAISVGVQLGPYSNNLNDVDLDCAEAVRIGGMLLPSTNATFGRKSKPRSHRLYVTDLAEHIKKAALQFRDVDGEKGKPGTMLLELRIGGGGKGAQSVFPGSPHPSGEQIEWFDSGEPSTPEGKALLKATRRTAAVALLARHWPIEGARHKAALVLGGVLARASYTAHEVAIMVEAIVTAANDPECADRVTAARDAVKKFAHDGIAYGTPALIEAFGKDVAKSSSGSKSKRRHRRNHRHKKNRPKLRHARRSSRSIPSSRNGSVRITTSTPSMLPARREHAPVSPAIRSGR